MSKEFLLNRFDEISEVCRQLHTTICSLEEFALLPKHKKFIARVNKKLVALEREDLNGLKKAMLQG